MKRFALIGFVLTSIMLSGCAILLGIPPVPRLSVGNMIVGVSAKTAYLYVSTDNPEPMEASLPFWGSLKFYYKDAVYDANYGYSGISIYNEELDMDFKAIPYGKLNNESPDKFPSEGNDSTKAVALFNNFFVDDFTNISVDMSRGQRPDTSVGSAACQSVLSTVQRGLARSASHRRSDLPIRPYASPAQASSYRGR